VLPPVQASSRSAVPFTDSATETAPLPNAPSTTGQDTSVRTDQNNSSLIAGHINSLLLSSRETVRADMATIADMVGSSIGINRKPGEADGAFAARFVTALANLDDGQRTALQKQLNQVLKGLQVQVLLQVLQNQDGPEAALLSAYMEIQRSNRDNLKAQTVVSSYTQNAESPSSGQGAANSAQTSPAQITTAPQTSITVALQASIAGAKDKEAVIANLAAALRQASSGVLADYETEATQLISASPLPSAEDEADTKPTARNPASAGGDTNASNTKALAAKIPDIGPSPAAHSPTPSADVTKNGVSSADAAATIPKAPSAEATAAQATKQPAVQTPSSSSLKADAMMSAVPAALPQTGDEGAPRSSAPAASAATPSLKEATTSSAASQQALTAATGDDRQINKEAAIATALSMKGWVEAPALSLALAPPIQADTQAETDTELFRHMFFQANTSNESAEATALRALANRPEAAQNADIANAQTADILEAETEKQVVEHAAPRAQAVLTLAGAQAVQTPAPSQIIFPMAVPVPLGNYLAMQQPVIDEKHISVDAIDALSDEEPRQNSNPQQHDNQEQTEDNDGAGQEGVDDQLDTMSDEPGEILNDAPDMARDEPMQAPSSRLPAPQDEALPAESLYWKIADLA
jgi:hypothetical protein